MRLHITGASGAGTTTLGQALVDALSATHLDTDAFYWAPTPEPFTEKVPESERLARLGAALERHPRCVLSGSYVSWGDPLTPMFDAVIFLYVPPEERMRRLRAREIQRYGDAVAPGGPRYEHLQAFLAWAATYDDGDGTSRSLVRHETWLAGLDVPVWRIPDVSVAERVRLVCARVARELMPST